MDKASLLQLLQNQFLSAGLILSSLAGVFLIFKNFGLFLWKRITRKVVFEISIEETDELYTYFERWLNFNYPKQYRNVVASLSERQLLTGQNPQNETPYYNSEKIKEDKIYYRQYADVIFIRYKKSLITISKNRDKIEHAKDLFSLFFGSYKLKIFFYKNKLTMLLNEIVEYNQQFKPAIDSGIINVYVNNNYGDWYTRDSKTIKPKDINHIILNKDKKDLIINDLERFSNNREWYSRRCIPYKRGYLLHGTPGNGKTSTALAIARKYNKKLYMLAMNDLKDGDLRYALNKMDNDAVLLIEDIDAIFDGRDSILKNLTFSNFLQCLDGVLSQDGLIVIVTTNFFSKLDSALLRDGRMDVKIEIDNPDKYLIQEYIELFYEVKLNGFLKDVKYNNEYSMSKIQNICLKNNNADIAIHEIFNLDAKSDIHKNVMF
jgi:chaperone BCS1